MKYPRTKRVLFPVQRTGHRIVLGTMQYGVGVEIQDDDDDHIWSILRLLDGTRTISEIVDAITKKDSSLERDSVKEVIEGLISQGFVEDAGSILPENISQEEVERYSRSKNFFSWLDRKPCHNPYIYQSTLKSSRVTVIGLGGTGSFAALTLAAMGVGNIHLVDFDTVELSNLPRQLLYNENDVGKPKVHQAVKRLKLHNSMISVTGENLKVSSDQDALKLCKKSDLVILCADSPFEELRLWLNEAAMMIKTPWIENHISGPSIALTMFEPFKTPCYQCALHEGEEEQSSLELVDPEIVNRPPEEHAAITPTVGVAGQLAALEAIYFLTGLPQQALGVQFRQSFFVYDHVEKTKLAFWKDCPLCGDKGKYRNK